MTGRPFSWASIESIHEGAEVVLRELITAELVDATASVTGDFNPVHVDAKAAKEIGASRPVAHGVILLGLLSRVIGMHLPGPGSIWFSNDVEFLAPVYTGDEIELRVRVSRVSAATSVVVLDVTARRLPDTQVMRGTAKVRVANRVANRGVSMTNEERTALVTGASRGVGKAIAISLGRAGLAVGVNYRTDEAGARDTVKAITTTGGRAEPICGDVATQAGAASTYDAAMAALGRIDVIVHNATPPIVLKLYADTTAEDFRAYFDTYVLGLHELVQRTLPQMKSRGQGRIIAILSSATAEVPPKYSAYIAGKEALHGFCRALAVELGPFGITVNTVSPSMLVGPRTDELGVAGREILARRTPLRRLGTGEDVARTVSFLASADAEFISGANVPVTGGVLF